MPSFNSPDDPADELLPDDIRPPSSSSWSKIGFFAGIGLFFISLALAFLVGPWSLALGLVAAILFGICNRKFGFVSGFFAGLLICIGLAFLALIVICGRPGRW